jgi:hypothetical protein
MLHKGNISVTFVVIEKKEGTREKINKRGAKTLWVRRNVTL